LIPIKRRCRRGKRRNISHFIVPFPRPVCYFPLDIGQLRETKKQIIRNKSNLCLAMCENSWGKLVWEPFPIMDADVLSASLRKHDGGPSPFPDSDTLRGNFKIEETKLCGLRYQSTERNFSFGPF
jgi:hypothetical protein